MLVDIMYDVPTSYGNDVLCYAGDIGGHFLMNDRITTLEIAPKPPFDFAKSLRFIAGFNLSDATVDLAALMLEQAVMVMGQPVAFKLSALANSTALTGELTSDEPLTPEIEAAALDRIRFYLSLDDDLTPFYAIAETDPSFHEVARYLWGYHQVKFITPFAAAVWSILAQRNMWVISRRMRRALMDTYGGSIAVNERPYPVFPEAGRVALATPDEVSAVIGHKMKGALIPGVARAFDEMDETWLRTAPEDEVEKRLRSIKGIGAWSAQLIMIRGLGRTGRFPTGERHLAEALARTYGLGLGATQDDIARLGKPYGDYIGYWAHYLRAAD
jgi:DNA-3-methyladenine glycosylase II